MTVQRKFLIGLSLYFLLHLIIRVTISNSCALDEGEQILLAQQFHLGYNSQPPLYNWIQQGVFAVFGLNIFSLAILKNALLFLMYFFIYKTARLVLRKELYAVLGSLSLIFIPQLAWNVHKDLSHSIVLLAVSAATFYFFIKIFKDESFKISVYLWLGVVMGFGFLSKYNYLVFVLALMLSAVGIKELRPKVLSKKMLLTAGVFLMMIAPHVYWLIGHIPQVTTSADRLEMVVQSSAMIALKSIGSFFRALASSVPIVIVFYLAFFPSVFKRAISKDRTTQNIKTFFERYFISSFCVIGFVIILTHVTYVNVRWLVPFLIVLPLYFLMRLEAAGKNIARWRITVFITLACVCAFTVLGTVMGRVVFAKNTRFNYPYSALAACIQKEQGFQKGLIIAQNRAMAGSLKLAFQDSFAIAPDTGLKPTEEFKKILVVWEPEESSGVPADLQKIISTFNGNVDYNKVGIDTKEALYIHSQRKSYRLNVAVIEKNKD